MHTSSAIRTARVHVANRHLSIERIVCIVLAIVVTILSIGLYRQAGWATSAWPLPGVRMTYIFLAGIGAAIVTPLIWVAWRDEFATFVPTALELMFGASAMGIYLFWLAWDGQGWGVALAGLGFAGVGMAGIVLHRWTKPLPFRDQRMLPVVFRAGFAIMTVILVVVGLPLVLQTQKVWPWQVTPATLTLIGLIFFSAAVLFGWITLNPHWPAGELALTAFLAYALVLFVPYIDLLLNQDDPAAVASYYGSMPFAATATDNGINETSMVVYLGVMAFGCLLAIGLYAWGIVQRSAATRQP